MVKVLGFVAVGCLMGWVQHADFEDAVAADRVYCEAVRSGDWPDYKGTYKEACPVKPLQTPAAH